MTKKILWALVSSLMALSLVMAACGPAAPATPNTPSAPAAPTTPVTPTTPAIPAPEKPRQEAVKPAAETPRYGGVLRFASSTEASGWNPKEGGLGGGLTNEELWSGDWTKGPAGGYGTNRTRWATNGYDIFEDKEGHIAESWKWTADAAKSEGTLVYQVRQGVHYGLNPKSEASRLVGGREVTANDVVYNLKLYVSYERAYLYRANPDLRAAKITKTGPREVTIKVPAPALMQAISRFGDAAPIYPPEMLEKYGDTGNRMNSVGSGAFMLTEYVAGSASSYVKNTNYWMKNPIGTGKGNQLPYIDGVTNIIVPDLSTRQAALRTGKIDQMPDLTWEEAQQFKKTSQALVEAELDVTTPPGWPRAIHMRVDKPPFSDIRVRRAMMMATDFEAIRQGVFGGRGQILSFPYEKVPGYEALYLGIDDPEFPKTARELYAPNLEKAKQLLKEAGYPNGFKTSALITAPYVDAYSIYKDMWAKVGIDLVLDVRESGVKSRIMSDASYEGVTDGGRGPVSIFHTMPSLLGVPSGSVNMSHVDDPVIREAQVKIGEAALTDIDKAMKLMKELTKHLYDQVYAIPGPYVPVYTFYWPWLKNYSGEKSVGYFNGETWARWVWIDMDLKKRMGY